MTNKQEHNTEARYFDNQVVIFDTTPASATSGSLVVGGGLITKDTYVSGHVAVNNVRITPNLNDIVYELESILGNNVTEWTSITDFYFNNSVATSFKALINVTVSSGSAKYAFWEINGVYKPSGWEITSSFTGDMTGVNFTIETENGIGTIKYKNSNTSGTTTIRYRASTNAPPGSQPVESTGLINNTSGPYIANRLLYANTVNTIANADVTYQNSVLSVGGTSRLVTENTATFTNFSNGGSMTSMGDASIAKRLIVGQKVGIVNTSPQFTLDVAGDINFTGAFYNKGSLYTGNSVWETNQQNDVYYTRGNLGIGTTDPAYTLDIQGNAHISNGLTVGSANISHINAVDITSGTVIATTVSSGSLAATNVTLGSVRSTDATIDSLNSTHLTTSNLHSSQIASTNITTGTLIASTGITAGSSGITDISSSNIVAVNVTTGTVNAVGVTAGNINFTGNLYQNGALYISSQWKSGDWSTISYNSGNVGVGTTSPTRTLDVVGSGSFTEGVTTGSLKTTDINATNSTLTNIVNTNISSGFMILSTGMVTTNISTGKLIASDGLTAGSSQISSVSGTNSTFTNATATNLVGTNTTITNATATNLVGTNTTMTNVSTASARITSIIATNSTLGTVNMGAGTVGGHLVPSANVTYNLGSADLRWNDIYLSGNTIHLGDKQLTLAGDTFTVEKLSVTNTSVATSASSGALVINGGLGAANANVTNIVSSNMSSGTANISNLSSTTINSTLVAATTITGGNLSLSGNLNVAGTLTVVNITATNLMDTNLTSGIARITTNLAAVGNSNTLGNIFTTGGNVGIGTVTPDSNIALDIYGQSGFDGSTILRLYNNASQYGRTQLRLVGRFELSNDAWSTSPRNAIMFQQQTAQGATVNTKYIIQNVGEQLGLLNASGTPIMVWNSTGNIGIANTNPTTAKLVIGGSAGATGLDLASSDQYAEMRVIRNALSSIDKDMYLQIGAGAGSKLRMYSNNSETMTLNGGSVGIGVSSPSTTLDVSGGISNKGSGSNGYITLLRGGANNTGYVEFKNTDDSRMGYIGYGSSTTFDFNIEQGRNLFMYTNAAVRMTISSAGNVGIGTTAPTAPLHVNGNIVMPTASRLTTIVNDNFIHSGNTVGHYSLSWNYDNVNGNAAYLAGYAGVKLFTAGQSRLFVNLDGNIGIGTTSPDSRLHVNGAITLDGETVSYGANTDAGSRTQTYITFRPNGTDNDWAYLRQIGAANQYLMALDIHDDGDEPGFCIRSVKSTDNPDTVNERFRVQGNGNVGIGITSPNNRLDIAAATRTGTHATGAPLYITGDIGSNANGVEIRHSNGTQGIGFGFNSIYATGSATNQDLCLFARGSGNVGINTASPSCTLDVAGTARVSTSATISSLSMSGAARVINIGHAQDTSNYSMEIVAPTSTGLLETSIRFHQEGRYWQQIRAYNSGFKFTQGDSGTLVNIQAAGITGSTATVTTGITTGGLEITGSGVVDTPNLTVTTAASINSLVVSGTSLLDGGSRIVVQNNQDGGAGRGIYMWNNGDPNWGIYMGQSGAGRSLAGGTACTGAGGFSAHAIRIRTTNSSVQGLIYENSAESCLFSVRGSDGMTFVTGNLGVGNASPGYKLDVSGDINFTGTLRQNGSAFGGVSANITAATLVASTAITTGGLKISGAGIIDTSNLTVTNSATINAINSTYITNAGELTSAYLRCWAGSQSLIIGITSGEWGPATQGLQCVNTYGSLNIAIQADPNMSLSASAGDSLIRASRNLLLQAGASIAPFPGTAHVYIQTSGNVGIGTTVPTAKLDVNGSIRATSMTVTTLTNQTTVNNVITNETRTNLVVTNGSISNLTVTGGLFTGVSSTTMTAGNLFVNGNMQALNAGSTFSTFGSLACPGTMSTNIVIFQTLAGNTSTIGSLRVSTSLSKASGTFDIEHPNDSTKRLVHSFIEGPRCDLIYRGKVNLVGGTAVVNLDTDCVADADCAMTEGTFESLCVNPQYSLQNHSSFNRVKGAIQGNILIIECEDSTSTDTIYWSVIAERKDPHIKQWDKTNSNGYLVTEYDPSEN